MRSVGPSFQIGFASAPIVSLRLTLARWGVGVGRRIGNVFAFTTEVSDFDRFLYSNARTLPSSTRRSKTASARKMSGSGRRNVMLDSERYRGHAAECLVVA